LPGPVAAVLIGAGNRGHEAYGAYALLHPSEIRFVAVAEPQVARRQRFAAAHGIGSSGQFSSWEDLLTGPKLADAALVCTQDRLHVEPALAALAAGYAVLLEKPMAATPADCLRLVTSAERLSGLLQICHVLRYTTLFQQVYDLIRSGRLGRVVNVVHRENISYWHMAHSYVRGNWRTSETASPIILAKCCHDLDILFWNLGRCRRLQSFGSLLHFRPENAPPGAPERCTDGCPAANSCPWYAPRLYLDLIPLLHVAASSPSTSERMGARLAQSPRHVRELLSSVFPPIGRALDYQGWPVSVISDDASPLARRQALQDGPYGRCVYRCDNDVVDHQTVNMEMQDGTTAVLVMQGHSHREGRTMRYDGTRATLFASHGIAEQSLEIHDHLTGKVEKIRPAMGCAAGSGHGGGDAALMAAFVRAVCTGRGGLSSARESLESHLLAFAAEESRHKGLVMDMEDYRARQFA
jgi:predicted dehydrogenase